MLVVVVVAVVVVPRGRARGELVVVDHATTASYATGGGIVVRRCVAGPSIGSGLLIVALVAGVGQVIGGATLFRDLNGGYGATATAAHSPAAALLAVLLTDETRRTRLEGRMERFLVSNREERVAS